MKKIISLSVLFICLQLTGCDSAHFKEKIQAKIDSAYITGNGGICLGYGAISYPYISTYIPPEREPKESLSWKRENKILNNSLHVFAQIGFFSEELAGKERGRPVYRYELTELGRQYFHLDSRFTHGFCFGRVKVVSLYDMHDPKETEYLSGEIYKSVSFKYTIDNIPEWVTENTELLAQRYKGIIPYLAKKEHIGSLTFIRHRRHIDKAMKEWHIAESYHFSSSGLYLRVRK